MCLSKSGSQLGIPLTEEILNSFNKKEKKLWGDFGALAEKEVSEAEERNETQPYIPSEKFRKMYERVIKEYNGREYCHVRQLETIFNFSISMC
ncbi:hypothetical protein BMS3Abin15_01058 [bacterium BMS3Abin15]|nr:hypothetical protein BMS3Abin15_01058 [bacterium BMS3Abin15]HDZ86044.1 hypothetical protein [Candidatus Moranbacteria bacterium]